MSVFSFVSHEKFPNDQYVKEVVFLCFENKYRVAYLRKKMQNGGMFWDVISASVQVQHSDKKKHIKSFTQDSNFLNDDIKDFLDNRKWEQGSYQKKQDADEIPF